MTSHNMTELSLIVTLNNQFTFTSPRNKTSIWGARPGISYKLRGKDDFGVRSWNIATQERKNCEMGIEIVTFVINAVWSWPPSRSTGVNPGKKQKGCSLSFLWSHIQKDICPRQLSNSGLLMCKTSFVPVCKIKSRCQMPDPPPPPPPLRARVSSRECVLRIPSVS